MAFSLTSASSFRENNERASFVIGDGVNHARWSCDANTLVVIVVSTENIGTTTASDPGEATGCSGDKTGTWTKAHEYRASGGAARDGALVAVYWKYFTTAVTEDQTTVTFGTSRQYKTGVLYRFAASTAPTQVSLSSTKAGEGQMAADAGALSISGLVSKDWLFFRGISVERSDYGFTVTTGWTAGSTDFVGDAQATGEYLFTTAATASGTSDPGTGGGTHDSASVLLAFTEGSIDPPREWSATVSLSDSTVAAQADDDTRATCVAQLSDATCSAAATDSASVLQKEWLAWLDDEKAARVVLIEANVYSGAAEIVRYISNKGYVSNSYIPNGDFTANTNGWTALNASIAATGGVLRATASGTATPGAHHAISVVYGKKYRLTFDFVASTTSNQGACVIGTTANGTDVHSESYASYGAKTVDFTAPSTGTLYITLRGSANSAWAAGNTIDFDNVKVAYITESGATTPADNPYEPLLVDGVQITEQITFDGGASLTFGDFEITNHGGLRDTWLDDIWTNRAIRVFIGDMSWPREKFRMVLDGTIANLDSRSAHRLNLVMRDKLQRLNNPVTEQKLATQTALAVNEDSVIPLTFGECHNIEPMMTSGANLDFQYHQTGAERLIEVRDNGYPITVDDFQGIGSFRLTAAPAGQITCSVQGDNDPSYTNSAAKIIERIVKNYGNTTTRFTSNDIDESNFDVFARKAGQSVGVYLPTRTNVLEVISELAQSIGAQLIVGRDGKLQIYRVQLPPGPESYPITTIEGRDFKHETFQIVGRTQVKAAVKLGYAKNWTVQDNLLTNIPAEHKILFRNEWLTVTKRDTTVASNYRSHVEPALEPTLLLSKTDAETEAQRRLDLRKTQRTIYRFEGFAKMLDLKLGQAVTLKHDRFGLDNGKTGMVITLAPDWLHSKCSVEVIV